METEVVDRETIKTVPYLRFKEFQKLWKKYKLEDFCNFFSGGTPSSTNKSYYSGTIPFIGSGNIFDNKVSSFITEEALQSSSAKMVNEGDLLYALYGANSGEVAVSKMKGAINQAILCIRSEENIYFIYSLLSLNQKKIITKYLQGGQGNLSARIIKNLKFHVPSLPEQQKIASFLSAVDNKIQQFTRKKDLLETYKKGVMQKLFSQEIRFKDEEGKEYSEWEEKRFDKLFKFKQGLQFPVEEQSEAPFKDSISFIRIINVTSDPNDSRFVKNPGKEYHLTSKDLFMVRYGDAGRIAMGFEGVIANNMFNLIPIQNLHRKFYYYLIEFNYKKLHNLAGSSTMPALNFTSLGSFKLLVPQKEEQQKIAEFLSAIDRKLEAVSQQIGRTQAFKKGLLQQMFV
ncbi:restriction endonuclease subunit S [Salinimicrobium catena]|uniref:restriction endonuclease subunit S n=1 Tax=Salinimicrobium catena TaxID=390640 RepID=UPI002FE4A62E